MGKILDYAQKLRGGVDAPCVKTQRNFVRRAVKTQLLPLQGGLLIGLKEFQIRDKNKSAKPEGCAVEFQA